MTTATFTRAIGASVFIVALVVVVAYHDDAVSALMSTDTDAVVPETVLADPNDPIKWNHTDMLKSICALRAYSELAYDKALDMKNQVGKSGSTGLINFVINFAKEAITENDKLEEANEVRQSKEIVGKQKNNQKARQQKEVISDEYFLLRGLPFPTDKDHIVVGGAKKAAMGEPFTYNVVVDYATTMAKLKGMYPTGINRYVLEHLAQSILTGNEVVKAQKVDITDRKRVTFDAEVLGFTEQPGHFRRLSVDQVKFQQKLESVKSHSKRADVHAAAVWLHSGEAKHFTSFIEKEQAKRAAKVTAYQKKKRGEALEKIKAAFAVASKRNDAFKRLTPLPAAGKAGAQQITAPTVRSDFQVKKDAQASAKKWMKTTGSQDTDKTLVIDQQIEKASIEKPVT